MTIANAVKKYKLDGRTRWFSFYHTVTRSVPYTVECNGCDGGGCSECGYKGKRRGMYTCVARDNNNKIIKTTSRDFTYANPKHKPKRNGIS